jgi:hypothetical protein
MKKLTNPVVKATAWGLCLGVMAIGAVPAFGATAGKSGGLGIGALIFLGLFALIILAQLLPGLVLFGSLLVALFTKAKAKVKGSDEASAGAGGSGEPR